MLYVEVGMYHGGELLLPAVRTGEVTTASSHPRWNQWLKFNIRVKNLPKVHLSVRACVHACVCNAGCCSAPGCKAAHSSAGSGAEGEEEDYETQHCFQLPQCGP